MLRGTPHPPTRAWAAGIDPEFLAESEHEHDKTITSIGFLKEGDLDMDKLNVWVSKLLQERGVDIFRMKGVLAISGSTDKYVFQAVHMLFHGETIEPWGDEPRINKFIIIGRNLPREEITSSFEACFVKKQADAEIGVEKIG